MIENPAVLAPIHTSLSDGDALGAMFPPVLTSPVKQNLSPRKNSSLLSRQSVSRCFHSSGLPSGVAFPDITTAVQEMASCKGKQRKKSMTIRNLDMA